MKETSMSCMVAKPKKQKVADLSSNRTPIQNFFCTHPFLLEEYIHELHDCSLSIQSSYPLAKMMQGHDDIIGVWKTFVDDDDGPGHILYPSIFSFLNSLGGLIVNWYVGTPPCYFQGLAVKKGFELRLPLNSFDLSKDRFLFDRLERLSYSTGGLWLALYMSIDIPSIDAPLTAWNKEERKGSRYWRHLQDRHFIFESMKKERGERKIYKSTRRF